MKKLILAGIVIIICCLVFLIVRQNSSQADIDVLYVEPYTVRFGDWVVVYLSALYSSDLFAFDAWHLKVGRRLIEGKIRFRISGGYNSDSELGRQWYQEYLPKIKQSIREACKDWTRQGYPISLNDFEFDIEAY